MATRPRSRSTRLLVVVLVSISLAIITLDYRGGPNGPLASLGNTAREAIAPMQKAVTSVTRPIGNFFSGLAHLPSLEEENRRLQEQNQELTTQVNGNTYLSERNAYLEKILSLQRTLDPTGVAAVVIGNGISNFEWTITLDKGTDDGVGVDMAVVTGGPDLNSAALVGHVISVTPHTSDVQLILDQRSQVAVVLEGSQEAGLAVGQGDEDLRVDHVAVGTQVAANEAVYTRAYDVNGLQGLYPPGILVGEVSSATPESNALQEPVTVRPAVDFSALEFVMVLRMGGGS